MLTQLHSRLTKPVLFALYGAFGGLLGALLLGEPAWMLLKPPTAKSVPTVLVSASREIVLDQGTRNGFQVRVLREQYSGPVRLRFRDVPTGVTLDEVTVPDGADVASVEAKAVAGAPTGAAEVTVEASAPAASDVAGKTTTFRLTVNPRPTPRVDVMFVLDITGSMDWAITGVKNGIGKFASELSTRELDFQVGVVAFRDISVPLQNHQPIVLRFPEDTFTSDPGRFGAAVSGLSASGGDDEPESSLDALSQATKQPFREGATRVLILITDAGPKLPDGQIASVEAAHRILVAGGIGQLHMVIPQDQRTVYGPLQAEPLSGKIFDLRTVAGDPSAFTNMLPDVSREIARMTIASQPPADLKASDAAPSIKGVSSSEQFEQGSGLRLMVAISVWMALAALGICLFLVSGQSLYLKKILPAPADGLKAAGGGLVAGLLGGAAGQILFQATSSLLPTDVPSRLLGWTVLGALAGGGLSFFVPNLKVSRALLGGVLGGFGGAIGYLIAEWIVSAAGLGDAPARCLGATLIGLCIGLMIAWAERASRNAWLEVRYGPNESRLVNLGVEPVTVGGDARRCTIWVRGADPVAAGYVFQQGRVSLTPAGGNATDVADGHSLRFGTIDVVVRTADGAGATPTPTATGRSVPPPPPPSRKNPTPVSAASPPAAIPPARPVAPSTPQPAVVLPPMVSPPPPSLRPAPSAPDRPTVPVAGKGPPPPPPRKKS